MNTEPVRSLVVRWTSPNSPLLEGSHIPPNSPMQLRQPRSLLYRFSFVAPVLLAVVGSRLRVTALIHVHALHIIGPSHSCGAFHASPPERSVSGPIRWMQAWFDAGKRGFGRIRTCRIGRLSGGGRGAGSRTRKQQRKKRTDNNCRSMFYLLDRRQRAGNAQDGPDRKIRTHEK